MLLAVLVVLAARAPAAAIDLDLSWWTMDSGGRTSTAANLALGGTLGQADAGVMRAGALRLEGGFWPGAALSWCDPCDTNCDGRVNSSDIEPFIDVLFDDVAPCRWCAGDANGDGTINSSDIEPFIGCLFGS